MKVVSDGFDTHKAVTIVNKKAPTTKETDIFFADTRALCPRGHHPCPARRTPTRWRTNPYS